MGLQKGEKMEKKKGGFDPYKTVKKKKLSKSLLYLVPDFTQKTPVVLFLSPNQEYRSCTQVYRWGSLPHPLSLLFAYKKAFLFKTKPFCWEQSLSAQRKMMPACNKMCLTRRNFRLLRKKNTPRPEENNTCSEEISCLLRKKTASARKKIIICSEENSCLLTRKLCLLRRKFSSA